MNQTAEDILKERQLKVTIQRVSILERLMADQTKAVSSTELLRHLENDMNRSTVYRVMDKLIAEGLVQKMHDENGGSMYTMSMKHEHAHSPHPHMKCNECNKVVCLPAFPEEYAQMLKEKGVGKLNVVIGGVCSECVID